MNEIKPDTSLYTDTVEKLRALTAVIEAQRAGSVIEWRRRDTVSEWTESGMTESGYSDCVLLDYRIKPKPRELWKLCLGDAMVERNFSEQRYAENFRAASSGLAEYTVVRFVESPE